MEIVLAALIAFCSVNWTRQVSSGCAARFQQTDMRRLLRLIVVLIAGVMPLAATAQGEIRLLVQSSPLAGFRYYAAEDRWESMKVGQPLTLVREPDNVHDANAIRVEWQGEKLGYLPRRENRAVAAAMDAGDKIDARIAKLREHRDPWQRVLIDVFVVL